MSEDVSDPKEEYSKTVKSIENLSALLRVTVEVKRRVYLEREIARLKNYAEQLDASFEMESEEAEETSAKHAPPRAESITPILDSIRSRFRERSEVRATMYKDIKDIASYVLYFEEEFLQLFDRKRIDLDHLNAMELETFYNLFSNLKRQLEIFVHETESMYEEKGAKTLKKIKAKQALYVDIFKFFKKVDIFAQDMVADIEGDQKHCYNGNAIIAFTQHERGLSLYGKSVRAGLMKVDEFAREVMSYLDLPSFKKA
jgi:hypothetical protein